MSATTTNPPAQSTGSQASGSQSASNTNSQSSSSSRLIIPASAPAGAISVTQPPSTATSYYKIAPSQTITFGWNFSYIIATPTHLTVQAIGDNGYTYPVGPTDGVIDGTATEVTWDLWAFQTSNPTQKLSPAQYTLNIFDERGPGAARAGGYLSPYSGLKFALYTPASYTPLADGWSCTTCNGSYARYMAHPAFAGIVATLIVVFLSGFTLFRRRGD